ncbi:uncharacterized protein LOC119363664 isoform X2 [Triticum dicoccoides]|uniref:uncharacterized protein LOC119363664 isoform X2 n=1 Tax=Triticum dicoccoides TaxID=85692 RepID=UPI00188DEA49|nr:uncharacterized protein LOC119363664 isoform X2 [Triticum dicoccoides]
MLPRLCCGGERAKDDKVVVFRPSRTSIPHRSAIEYLNDNSNLLQSICLDGVGQRHIISLDHISYHMCLCIEQLRHSPSRILLSRPDRAISLNRKPGDLPDRRRRSCTTFPSISPHSCRRTPGRDLGLLLHDMHEQGWIDGVWRWWQASADRRARVGCGSSARRRSESWRPWRKTQVGPANEGL